MSRVIDDNRQLVSFQAGGALPLVTALSSSGLG